MSRKYHNGLSVEITMEPKTSPTVNDIINRYNSYREEMAERFGRIRDQHMEQVSRLAVEVYEAGLLDTNGRLPWHPEYDPDNLIAYPPLDENTETVID